MYSIHAAKGNFFMRIQALLRCWRIYTKHSWDNVGKMAKLHETYLHSI
jgi:hypothetical protein